MAPTSTQVTSSNCKKCVPQSSGELGLGPIGGLGLPLFASLSQWQLKLQDHPDKDFVHYILEGILHGFRVGFNYMQESSPLCSETSPQWRIIFRLCSSILQIRLIGPLASGEAVAVHCSPIGIISKQHKPGKWRLIHDLSSPEGASINDGISPDLSSLIYLTVDQVAQGNIVRLGPGTLLAKLDAKSAYKIVPVHADDHSLLNLSWGGKDSALPFGLRSACKIFSALADAHDIISCARTAPQTLESGGGPRQIKSSR